MIARAFLRRGYMERVHSGDTELVLTFTDVVVLVLSYLLKAGGT